MRLHKNLMNIFRSTSKGEASLHHLLSSEKEHSIPLQELLTQIQEKQLFLDAKIDLLLLAESTKRETHEIRSLLERELHCDLHSLLNHYRIRHFENLTKKSLAHQDESINLYVFQSGFKNRKEFDIAFQKIFDMDIHTYFETQRYNSIGEEYTE